MFKCSNPNCDYVSKVYALFCHLCGFAMKEVKSTNELHDIAVSKIVTSLCKK